MIDLIKKTIKSKLAKNGFYLVLLQGFNTIIPMLTLPYITRILSKSMYGEFSLALNWIGYLQVIVEYGFALTGARKAATNHTEAELSKIHSNIISARILLTVLSAIFLFVVLLFVPFSKSQLMCLVILSIMVVSTAFQQNWFFQGMEEMQNIAIINIIARTISVVLIFICVKQHEDIYLYCLLYVSTYAISSILGLLIVRFKYKVRYQATSFRSILDELKEGWYLFVSSATSKLLSGIGVTILGFTATDEQLGAYSAIYKIPYVLALLSLAITQAFYPSNCQSFAKSYNNGKKRVKKIATITVTFFAVCGLFIIVFQKPLVYIAFGEQYVEDSKLLIPFTSWIIISIINNFLGVQTLVASGYKKEYSRAVVISIIIMGPLMLILGYYYQAMGIAIAQLIAEAALSIILFIDIKKIDKTSYVAENHENNA